MGCGMNKRVLVGIGTGLMVLSVLIIGVSLWEGLGGVGRGIKTFSVPGFQELDLDTPGLYAGVYQHQGEGPVPVEALSKLDVRILSKESYQDVPVLMNSSGQSFGRLGLRGMVLFNVLVEKPGFYSFSALYKEGVTGPTVPLLFIAQSAQTFQRTLLVGGFFFLVFLGLGIFILLKARKIN